jgi:3-oxoacyl-[acyl-carrier-protein] synthase-3
MDIGIIAADYCLGEIVQSNESLEKIVDNFDRKRSQKSLDDWMIGKFGIESRVKTEKLASELAIEACKKLLKKTKINALDIDFLILNTTSGDYKQPTTATIVQSGLGLKSGSFALEINMPCAGNIYGIATAYSYINSGLGRLGLVVGVDKMSAIVDQNDFILSGIFGDAASACLVGVDAPLSISNIFLNSKADVSHTLAINSGGSANPLDANNLNLKNHLLRMKGRETKEFIRFSLGESINNLLKKAKLKTSEVDQLIIHQASKPIIEETLQELGFKPNQYFFTLDKYGNTSSASVMLTLAVYLEKKERFSNLFLIGMGAGLNWGGISLKAT